MPWAPFPLQPVWPAYLSQLGLAVVLSSWLVAGGWVSTHTGLLTSGTDRDVMSGMLARCPGTAKSAAGGGSSTWVCEVTPYHIHGGGRETPHPRGIRDRREECLALQADTRGEQPCVLSSVGFTTHSLVAAVFLMVMRVGDGAQPRQCFSSLSLTCHGSF